MKLIFVIVSSSPSFVYGWDGLLRVHKVIDRRNALLLPALAVASPCWVALNHPSVAQAIDDNDASSPKLFLKGTVVLKSNISLNKEECSNSAVYITARPKTPDNVPRAILDGSNGKPPPILASRISNPSFPLHFELTALDLTTEGATLVINQDDKESSKYWFEGSDFIVSARWDTDGIAATRDPTDLVGRAVYLKNGEKDLMIELTGRGLTGKIVTSKSNK